MIKYFWMFTMRGHGTLELRCSGESVVKYSLMVLHVSDDKRVHQALVDPKSIVPYYVVTTCVILHNLISLKYPATHNNLMDLEDQNQNVIPGAWRNGKVLLDVYHERASNTGTQEGRQIRR
jgi:hypothetical protein